MFFLHTRDQRSVSSAWQSTVCGMTRPMRHTHTTYSPLLSSSLCSITCAARVGPGNATQKTSSSVNKAQGRQRSAKEQAWHRVEPSRRIENDNTHAIELQQNRATASEFSLRRPAALLSSRNYTPTFEKRNKQTKNSENPHRGGSLADGGLTREGHQVSLVQDAQSVHPSQGVHLLPPSPPHTTITKEHGREPTDRHQSRRHLRASPDYNNREHGSSTNSTEPSHPGKVKRETKAWTTTKRRDDLAHNGSEYTFALQLWCNIMHGESRATEAVASTPDAQHLSTKAPKFRPNHNSNELEALSGIQYCCANLRP